jgi:hypothetical protein
MWLSADLFPSFTELEKIEELTRATNFRGFDEFQECREEELAN